MSQLRKRMNIAFKLQHWSVPFVLTLFVAVSPAAVFGRVITIGVDAVEGASRRSHTHVANKIGEAIDPSVTHTNASTTVVLEAFCLWIEAPTEHSSPTVVRRCVAEPVLQFQAPATFHLAKPEIAGGNDLLVSARALAVTHHAATAECADDSEKVERFADQFVLHSAPIGCTCNIVANHPRAVK